LGERQIGALEMHCKKKRHASLKNFEIFARDASRQDRARLGAWREEQFAALLSSRGAW
jgi:hypothetical protein